MEIAIVLAVIGVAIQTAALGHLPVISLILATTFWIYGLIRRQIGIDAQAGLLIECLFMALPGVVAVGARIYCGNCATVLLAPLLDPRAAAA